MIINILFIIYAFVLVVFGTFISAYVLRDLLTGRYKRFKKLDDEFSDFEREVNERLNRK